MGRTRRRGIGHEAEGGAAVLLIVVLLLFMGMFVWAAAYAGASGKVPRGTSVAGVDIGGRGRVSATQALTRGLRHQQQTPITITVGTVTTQVTPAEAGLYVNPGATVGRVLGPRSWDPRQLWRYYTGGDQVDPVVDVDQRRMDALFDRLDEQAGQPPRDAGISLTGGQISLTKPRDGAQLDREQARAALLDAYVDGLSSVTLPLLLTSPDVDAADLSSAVRDIANPAVSGPVTLAFAGSQVVLEPRDFASLLSLVDRGGVLTLDVDSARLASLVDPSAHDTQPVDAGVALEGGEPGVVPAVAGQAYDEKDVTEAFLRGVTAEGAARTVPVSGTATRATFTDRDARALGVDAPIASYSVSVPSSVGPSFTDAVARLDGALLRPGDTFSFNGRVGAVGGSAARLATATWNAGFLAGLTDVARTPLPTWSAGLPEGRDATVDAATDLQMRNDSSYGVLLSARVSGGSVVVDVWSTKEWDVAATTSARYSVTPRTTVTDTDPGCVAQPGADGFTVDLVRSFSHLGDAAPVRSDTVTTVYKPVQAVVCRAAAQPGH